MSARVLTRYALGAAASVSVMVLAACSSSGGSSGGPASTPVPPSSGSSVAAGSSSGVTTEKTSIGTVAADASGHTLYELVGDTTASPTCTGSCLSVWPAAMSNGTQIVLGGHPAFTFAEDTSPGQVSGQGAKDQWGTWYALDSSGNPIMATSTPAAPSSSASSSQDSGGSGGYGY